MAYIDLKEFEGYIVERELVPENRRSFFLSWVTRFLRAESMAACAKWPPAWGGHPVGTTGHTSREIGTVQRDDGHKEAQEARRPVRRGFMLYFGIIIG